MSAKTLTPPAADGRIFHPRPPDPSAPEAYYDSVRGCFWIRDNRDGWVQLNETGVKRFFRAQGISTSIGKNKHVSPLDAMVLDVQTTRNVTYAGPLSGYKVGVYEMLGGRVLVTDSPRMIQPKAGSWDTLRALLLGMLVDELFDQTPYFFGWLKVALEALRADRRRTGQALAIAGPSNCGKSLLQRLITELTPLPPSIW
jgi:hypothetical protein